MKDWLSLCSDCRWSYDPQPHQLQNLCCRAEMTDKHAYEAFRVLQFAGVHPALRQEYAAAAAAADGGQQQAKEQAGDPLGINLVPDHERVIVHFDVDCFYAQGELCLGEGCWGYNIIVNGHYLMIVC